MGHTVLFPSSSFFAAGLCDYWDGFWVPTSPPGWVPQEDTTVTGKPMKFWTGFRISDLIKGGACIYKILHAVIIRAYKCVMAWTVLM